MSQRHLFFLDDDAATSSNRKRSFAEITRSKSRSLTPHHRPAKRQRLTLPTTSSSRIARPTISSSFSTTQRDHNNSHIDSTVNYNPQTQGNARYGLDYWRSVMDPNFIDLTGENPRFSSSSTSSRSNTPVTNARRGSRRRHDPEFYAEEDEAGAGESDFVPAVPRMTEAERQEQRNAVIARTQAASRQEPQIDGDIIINLTESDDEEPSPGQDHTASGYPDNLFEDAIEEVVERSSPEVTFVEERNIVPPPFHLPPRNERRLPTPDDRRPTNFLAMMPNLPEFIRAGLGRNTNAAASQAEQNRVLLTRNDLNRRNGHPAELSAQGRGRTLHGVRHPATFIAQPDLIEAPHWVDLDLDLNYEAAAFDVLDRPGYAYLAHHDDDDADALEILDGPPWQPVIVPQANAAAPHDQPKPPYVKPQSPPEGFTMNYNENDVLECPNCHDELGVGPEDSVKSQVWLAKQCGHVYCGECATNRSAKSRTGGKKGKAGVEGVGKGSSGNTTSGKLGPPFSECVVPGCGKNVRGGWGGSGRRFCHCQQTPCMEVQ